MNDLRTAEKNPAHNAPRKRNVAICAVLGALFVILVIILLVRQHSRPLTVTDFAMDTSVSVTLYGGNDKIAAGVTDSVHTLDAELSRYSEGSETSEINARSGQETPVAAALLKKLLPLCEQTGGKYDPLCGALVSLWGFDTDHPAVPDSAAITDAVAACRYDEVQIDGDHVALPTGALLDFGSVGKGAACDSAIQYLQSSGASGAVVAVGGSIGLYGQKPDGSLFSVGVRDPYSADETACTASLPGGKFISTSGAYEQYFTENDRVYHHLLDATTGYPSQAGLASVTIICEDGALSDALSTACYVVGLEGAEKLISAYGADAIFITDDNRFFYTSGIASSVRIPVGSAYQEITVI